MGNLIRRWVDFMSRHQERITTGHYRQGSASYIALIESGSSLVFTNCVLENKTTLTLLQVAYGSITLQRQSWMLVHVQNPHTWMFSVCLVPLFLRVCLQGVIVKEIKGSATWYHVNEFKIHHEKLLKSSGKCTLLNIIQRFQVSFSSLKIKLFLFNFLTDIWKWPYILAFVVLF